MKISGNNAPEGPEQKPQSGNVYAEAFNGYKEKLKNGGFLRSNKFWVVVLVALFMVFISVNSNTSGSKSRLTAQIRRTQADTDKLTEAVDELTRELKEQQRMEELALTEDEEELARNDAKVQGAEVARLQNVYLSIDETYIPQMDAAIGDEDASREITGKMAAEISANKEELAKSFDDDGVRDGQGIWYSYNTNGVPGRWEFATNASFKGNTTKALWLCYSDDRMLLAYATSDYNADTKLFGTVTVRLTSYAEANVRSDIDPSKPVGDKSLTEQMQDLVDQGVITSDTPPADQPFGQDTIDTNNEIQDARDAYKESVKNGSIDGEGYDPNYDVGLPGSHDPSEPTQGSSDASEPTQGSSDASEPEQEGGE